MALKQRDYAAIARLLAVIWLGLAFVVFMRELAGNITVRDWNYDALNDLWNITFNMWFPWVIMSPFVVMAVKRFLLMPEHLKRNLLIHLFLVAAFIIIHLAAVAYHYQYLVPDKDAAMRVYAGWEHMGHFLVADPFILTDFIVYVLFVASFNISSHIQIVSQKEQLASRLETHLAESKLRALQMQVNPHFLFNTLNSITALIRKRDVETAEEMIHRLSDFFRMTLERNIGQIVPLEVELELVENYLAIERQRFRDRLRVNKSIDPRTLALEVPALMLQPLVENSLKHGINAMDEPGLIELRSRLLGDRLLLEVIDNGPGNADPDRRRGVREGIGLSNVGERLQQLYGGKAMLAIDSRPGSGTRVSIEIPIPPASEAADADEDDSMAPVPDLSPSIGKT